MSRDTRPDAPSSATTTSPPATGGGRARLVRKQRSSAPTEAWRWAPSQWLSMLREYFGLSRSTRLPPVTDVAGLAQFLSTRASFVSQTSLYGYLRTRAGMRYPELFDDDPFVASINVAKWHVWLACLSDLSVHAGGLLARDPRGSAVEAGRVVSAVTARILDETGLPPEAGDAFADHVRQVRERLAACDWASVGDGDAAFVDSPVALVKWSPIVDELKQLDEGIVTNSIRFRWQEVRRDLRRCLDTDAVLRSAAG